MSKLNEARAEMEANDPPVKVGQIWVAGVEDKIIRRVRVLAPYPEKGLQRTNNGGRSANEKLWIYEELAGGTYKLEIGRLGVFPEFNLRYVCRREDD